MGKTVNVTKVTLEYAFEGKLFTVNFPDPSKIESIVFSKIELDRLQKQQKVDKVKEFVERKINPGKSFPRKADGIDVLATSKATDEPTPVENGTEGRSLWWHSSSCSWLHPEEDE